MYADIGRDQQYYADAERNTRAVNSDAVDKWLLKKTVQALHPETIQAIRKVFNPTARPLTDRQVAILHMRDRLRLYSAGNVLTFNAWTIQMATSTETWICLHYGTYFRRIVETAQANREFIMDDPELSILFTNFRSISHREKSLDCLPKTTGKNAISSAPLAHPEVYRHPTLPFVQSTNRRLRPGVQ